MVISQEIKKIIKILMLEDQEEDADLAKRALRKGEIIFEAMRVDDRESFEKALDDFKPDIILSDHALPQFNSIQALKILRQRAPQVPFILVTGAVSEEFAVQCIKLGADDYILKSNLSRLPASLKNAIEHRAMESDLKKDEKALREQNELLIKANKEIDSFVYSVSHNLRSPLTSVLGLVNIARHEATTGTIDFSLYFNLIEQSIKKLDETIKEILDYSRNERTDIISENIEWQLIIDDCLDRIQYVKGFDKIDKQIDISSPFPFHSDAYRISVILGNLFSNSVKYMDEQKAQSYLHIDVAVTREQAKIEITDNGIGIVQGLIPKIYNMFYRATDRSEGAGLGLYIVKETVTKLNGTISITSELNQLTTFILILPNRWSADS